MLNVTIVSLLRKELYVHDTSLIAMDGMVSQQEGEEAPAAATSAPEQEA
jgi:hypothetical protein